MWFFKKKKKTIEEETVAISEDYIIELVRSKVSEVFGCDIDSVTMEFTVFREFFGDYYDASGEAYIFKVMRKIEDELDIIIVLDDDAGGMCTVGDIVTYLMGRLTEPQ